MAKQSPCAGGLQTSWIQVLRKQQYSIVECRLFCCACVQSVCTLALFVPQSKGAVHGSNSRADLVPGS